MRILIVEDEPKVATFISKAISEAGYFPEIAQNAEKALMMIEDFPFDVILLDNMLPGMLGRELCAKLRADGNKTLIIMLTANDGVDDRVLGLDAGADDYLSKPFSIEELMARVRALMRRRPNDLTTFTVGDLSLDPSTRKASRGGQEWALSSREYALLEYLMRNAHRPVTRAMITQYVWGIDSEVDSNIIDVYIRYLRNKIDRPSEPSMIKSLRGVGYQLG